MLLRWCWDGGCGGAVVAGEVVWRCAGAVVVLLWWCYGGGGFVLCCSGGLVVNKRNFVDDGG